MIEKAKEYFYETINVDADPWELRVHVPEAERWANIILSDYPEADQEVIMVAIWLHDIAHYESQGKADHAVVGEERTRQFLIKNNYDEDKIEAVCHCVRSHRNKDVEPQTLEAKLMCLIDSVSHFTCAPYIAMVRDGRGDKALEKLERDYRDLGNFPKIKADLTPIYLSWKKLLEDLMNSNWYKK